MVHGVSKSWSQLKQLSRHAYIFKASLNSKYIKNITLFLGMFTYYLLTSQSLDQVLKYEHKALVICKIV